MNTDELHTKPLGTLEEEFSAVERMMDEVSDPGRLREGLSLLRILDRLLGIQGEPSEYRQRLHALYSRIENRISGSAQ